MSDYLDDASEYQLEEEHINKNIENTMTKEKKHAKLSASGSSKWLNCPGSINAESKIPNKSSVYAEEGTTAHELADICLKSTEEAAEYIGKEITYESNGKEVKKLIDAEMAKYVQEYIDYVLSFETKDSQLFTEDRVDFSNLVPNGFGTMDSAVIDHTTGICHIFDLKYGKGVRVDAENNTQAQLYALGLLNELDGLDLIRSFVIHIVQPRVSNFSSWEISLKDLIKFGEYCKKQAELALTKTAPRIPGDKQCQWCRAKGSCKSLMKFTEEVITGEFDDLDMEELCDNEISDQQIKLILDNKKLIESFLTSVEEDAFDKLLSGGKIPGYKLVEGRSTRKWIDNAEDILVEKLGDDAYDKKLIGITKAGKKLKKDQLEELTFKPEGKPTIAPESDKRKSISSVVDEFEHLSDEFEEL